VYVLVIYFEFWYSHLLINGGPVDDLRTFVLGGDCVCGASSKGGGGRR
jgi:hypothetical protein